MDSHDVEQMNLHLKLAISSHKETRGFVTVHMSCCCHGPGAIKFPIRYAVTMQGQNSADLVHIGSYVESVINV